MDPNNLDDVLGASTHEEWMRLGRFLDGRSTPGEIRVVQQWLADDPRRQELVHRLQRAALTTDAAPGLWDVDAAWSRLRVRLDAEAVVRVHEPAVETDARSRVVAFRPRPTTFTPTRRRSGGFAVALRAAAAVAVLAGGFALWQGRVARFGPAEVLMQELATEAGQQVRTTLADGTHVVLGPQSRLSFPKHFGDTRDVGLVGEAVFDVAADRARPFRVYTAGSVTQVLGTRFGVHAYPGDEYAEVIVAEGRVSVAAAGEAGAASASNVELTPGLAVRVWADGRLDAPRAVDARRSLAWTDGLLAFNELPLAEVVRTFERRYGLKIELAEPALGALRLTAEFREPVTADAVRLIALSLGIEYRRVAGGYLFLPSSRATEMSPNPDPVP